MTLNVDLEDVPFAILEAVKARILAGRRRAAEQQQRPKPSTRPRPQQRKFGASSGRWVRPEPAAVPLEELLIGHAVDAQTAVPAVVWSLYVQPSINFGGGLITQQQIGTLTTIGWTIRSGDWSQSLSYSTGTSVPSLPTATWNYSLTPRTGQVTLTTSTIRVYRAGTTSNCTENGISYPAGNFVQEYGTFTETGITSQDPTINITEDIISQCGGPFPSFNSQYEAVLAANANTPFPPCHFYSEVYFEVTGSSSSPVTVTIAGEYVLNWSNTALLAASSSLQTKAIVLPAGGEACIVVMMQRYSHAYVTKAYSGSSVVYESPHTMTQAVIPWPPTSATPLSISATRVNKAYLCTRQSVREITVPTELGKVLNVLNPPFTYSSALGGSVSYPNYVALGTINNADDYFVSTSDAYTWSPSVFAGLNAVYQFVDPSQLRDLAPGKRPVLTDSRYGYYAESSTDRGLYYAEWTGDRNNIDPEQVASMQRLPMVAVMVPQNPGQVMPGFTLNAVWDWDDPIYCQSMCSALGFTAADLQP